MTRKQKKIQAVEEAVINETKCSTTIKICFFGTIVHIHKDLKFKNNNHGYESS